MILSLSEFVDFPAKAHLEIESPELSLDRDDVVTINAITVDLGIQHAGEEYYCQGTVRARMMLECARCLTEFPLELSGPTDFIVRSPVGATDNDTLVPDTEDYADLRDDLKADISALVRQTVILAIPIKPICVESCKGLCSMCGANRNISLCDCKEDKTDERWEGLAGLSQK